MYAPLTLLRRLGTSLMLVAVLAFAVSVSVVPAGTFGGPVEHLSDAGPDHQHMHADGTVHSHLVETEAVPAGDWPGFPPLDGPQDHEHQKPSCCSLMPLVALIPADTAALAFDGQVTERLAFAAVSPFGLEPNGLRRPPRLLPNA
nr:DNA polymerase III subunit gamma/tau [Methylobacterium sp. L1A1]